MSVRFSSSPLSLRYTLQFKNGQLLRHQGPLDLAQFRSDIRLAAFWPEPIPAALSQLARSEG